SVSRCSCEPWSSTHPHFTFVVLLDFLLRSIHFFFFTDPATSEIYTLSLHDALPISLGGESQPRFTASFISSTALAARRPNCHRRDRKSTRLNSSHRTISYAVFCLKKKKSKNPACYVLQTQHFSDSCPSPLPISPSHT